LVWLFLVFGERVVKMKSILVVGLIALAVVWLSVNVTFIKSIITGQKTTT